MIADNSLLQNQQVLLKCKYSGGLFETEMYSIAFNVNDNMSVSYGKATDITITNRTTQVEQRLRCRDGNQIYTGCLH